MRSNNLSPASNANALRDGANAYTAPVVVTKPPKAGSGMSAGSVLEALARDRGVVPDHRVEAGHGMPRRRLPEASQRAARELRVVRPPPLEELELVLDARHVRVEEQPSLVVGVVLVNGLAEREPRRRIL